MLLTLTLPMDFCSSN